MSLLFWLGSLLLFAAIFATSQQNVQGKCVRHGRSRSTKEIFAFFNGCKKDVWSKFPWHILTTIAVGNCFDPEFICTAHQQDVRVVIFGSYPVKDLLNERKRMKWINSTLKIVQDNDMDGLNIDFEENLVKNSTEANALTQLAADATRIFHQASSHLQVSFDFAWAPGCVDQRCYDYIAISKVVDLVFVMSYDEQSQIFDKHCTAKANSGMQLTRQGIQQYLKLGLPADKIILGLPWYGYDYTCLNISKNNTCEIAKIPFRGVNCSDAAGKQVSYGAIVQSLLPQSTTGRLWSEDQQTPYFNYKTTDGVVHQVWYDDPASLAAKYSLVMDLGLRGAGMWSAEQLDYTDHGASERRRMWRAISPPRAHPQAVVV